MRRDWRDCAPRQGARSGRGQASYDVLITDVNFKVKEETEWKRRCLSFTFRNKGRRRIEDSDAVYLRISSIQPNTSKIYFDFMPDNYDSRALGRKLSKDETAYVAKFPYISEHERKIIVGHWIGEYKLQYDADCGDYYIENKTVRGWRL